MKTKLGEYDHLNKDFPNFAIKIKGEGVECSVSVDAVVDAIFNTNHGLHRVLSAIIFRLRYGLRTRFANALWFALEEGYFDDRE